MSLMQTKKWARGALGLAALCALMGTAARAGTPSPTPPGIADDWSTGTWESDTFEEPYTGFASLDAYGDPKAKPKWNLPFTPAYKKRFDELRQAAFDGKSEFDQGNTCAPLAVPYMTTWGLMEIMFTKGRIAMIFEEDGGVRRIHTDGRDHPTGDDLELTYNGNSIGHWEGKTLVIDTIGLRDDTYIEVGVPHSTQLHVIERWTQVAPDKLVNDETLIDPVAFTAPIHRVFPWHRNHNKEILEDFCVNNRDRNVGGDTTMIGPDGKPLLAPPSK